jgi:NADH-quinone oxidoreductase subunit L
MLIPLGVLALGALFAGLVFSQDFIGEGGAEFWKSALYLSPGNHILEAREDIPTLAKQLPTLLMVLGFLVAALFYLLAPSIPGQLARSMKPLYEFLLNKWYFDELYDAIFVRPAFWLGRLFWKGGDGAIIDRLGPDGVAARVVDVTGRVVKLQSGYIYHYAFAMLVGLAAVTTWYVASGVR